MESRLSLRYTSSLIKFHRKTQGFDAGCKSTVNLACNILQPKRIKMQKIQQGTKNEGKWKEAIMHQAEIC